MPYKLLLAICLGPCLGCMLYRQGTSNLFHESVDYAERQHLTYALRKEGQAAWPPFAAAHPEWADCAEFEDGFVDGFADYLDRGGNGEPPAVPPKRYRHNKYLNPEGFLVIERYFAGFAAGSRVAIESGLRETLVVPVLVPVRTDSVPAPRHSPVEAEIPPMSPTLPSLPAALPEPRPSLER